MKKAFLGIIACALVVLAARDGLRFYRAYTMQDATSSPSPPPTPSPHMVVEMPEPVANENISVSAPQKDTNVSLPFTVAGTARVFESTVVIALKNTEGRELYRDIATATAPDHAVAGPFTKTVTFLFKKPEAPEATLEVFWHSPKDGEILDLVRIPVMLNLGNLRDVKVFFPQAPQGGSPNCGEVVSVERMIPGGAAPATVALELLLHGPSPKEFESGYATVIPVGIAMPRIAIAQGTATVDFGNEVQEIVSDVCRARTFRAQIERTLYQFPTVSGVVIAVEGNVLGG